MGSEKTDHSLGITPGPTASGPTNYPSYSLYFSIKYENMYKNTCELATLRNTNIAMRSSRSETQCDILCSWIKKKLNIVEALVVFNLTWRFKQFNQSSNRIILKYCLTTSEIYIKLSTLVKSFSRKITDAKEF